MRRKLTLAVCWILAAAWLSGCAVMDDDRRKLTTLMDDRLAPESEAGRWALGPVAAPVGLVALTCDAALVNPVLSAPKAFDDANETLFIGQAKPYTFGSFVKDVRVSPVQAVVWPVVFVGSETFRVCLPFEP